MLRFVLRAVQDLASGDLLEVPGGMGVFRVVRVEIDAVQTYRVHLESQDGRTQVLIVRARGDQLRVVEDNSDPEHDS